jgi:hypothetical protein
MGNSDLVGDLHGDVVVADIELSDGEGDGRRAGGLWRMVRFERDGLADRRHWDDDAIGGDGRERKRG